MFFDCVYVCARDENLVTKTSWHLKLFNGTICAKSLGTLAVLSSCLINTPLSPSKQCWFMDDIHAAHTSIYLQISFMGVSVYLNIVLRGRGLLSSVVARKHSIVMESTLLNEYYEDFWQRLIVWVS